MFLTAVDPAGRFVLSLSRQHMHLLITGTNDELAVGLNLPMYVNARDATCAKLWLAVLSGKAFHAKPAWMRQFWPPWGRRPPAARPISPSWPPLPQTPQGLECR